MQQTTPAPEDQFYVEQLGGYDLDQLSKEPVRLSIERRKIESNIEQSTLDNYRVHVDSYRAVCATAGACHTMQERMTHVEHTIRDIQQQQQPVLAAATTIAHTYQRYRQTLRQHSQLVEILDIPQLMARCVRVHAVEESLELASFVIKMERLHVMRQEMKQMESTQPTASVDNEAPTIATKATGPNAPVSGLTIIRDIKRNVFRSLDMLYTKLTDTLSSRVNLTDSLRVVGHLRRLSHIRKSQSNTNTTKLPVAATAAAPPTHQEQHPSTHMGIHEIFLHCREIFFQREIDRITNTEPYEYLESLVEVYRIYLYDIISQYQNIFIDEEEEEQEQEQEQRKGTTSSKTGTAKPSTSHQAHLSKCIFSHVSHLLSQIKVLLPVIGDGSLLYNILEQTMNLGQSLSKVGCDFRPLLVLPFEQAMLHLIRPTWNEGRNDFHEAMSMEEGWHRLSQTLRQVEEDEKRERQDNEHQAEAAAAAAAATAVAAAGVTYYHQRLLACRPLAHLTNAMIDGFNELRKCASMSIRGEVMQELINVLKDVWDVVCTVDVGGKSEERGGEGKQDDDTRRSLQRLVRIDFVGVLQYCFGEIFGFDGVEHMVATAGMVVQEKKKKEKEKEGGGNGRGTEERKEEGATIGTDTDTSVVLDEPHFAAAILVQKIEEE